MPKPTQSYMQIVYGSSFMFVMLAFAICAMWKKYEMKQCFWIIVFETNFILYSNILIIQSSLARPSKFHVSRICLCILLFSPSALFHKKGTKILHILYVLNSEEVIEFLTLA